MTKELGFSFGEWEAKLVLECLVKEEHRLQEFCAVSEEEDAVADAGNDLIKLRILLNRLKDQAVKEFGRGVLDFDKDPI